VLVLHDWGGSIGLDWARRHRDRVAGLVLTEARLRTYRAGTTSLPLPVNVSVRSATPPRDGSWPPPRTCSSETSFPMESQA
jgi:pimeloyl-ACP methyl ester carboxylesterase